MLRSLQLRSLYTTKTHNPVQNLCTQGACTNAQETDKAQNEESARPAQCRNHLCQVEGLEGGVISNASFSMHAIDQGEMGITSKNVEVWPNQDADGISVQRAPCNASTSAPMPGTDPGVDYSIHLSSLNKAKQKQGERDTVGSNYRSKGGAENSPRMTKSQQKGKNKGDGQSITND